MKTKFCSNFPRGFVSLKSLVFWKQTLGWHHLWLKQGSSPLSPLVTFWGTPSLPLWGDVIYGWPLRQHTFGKMAPGPFQQDRFLICSGAVSSQFIKRVGLAHFNEDLKFLWFCNYSCLKRLSKSFLKWKIYNHREYYRI